MRAAEAVREMFQRMNSRSGESSGDERASELLTHTGWHFQSSEVQANPWLASHPEESSRYIRNSPAEKAASAYTPPSGGYLYRCWRQTRSCLLRG